MAAKTYLITGGSGFIGSALAKALVHSGQNVRIFDNQSRGATRRLAPIEKECELIEGDVRSPELVEKAVRGVDVVCHLAFINGTEFFYSKPELVLDVGIKGIVNVIDACVKHSIPELVIASSSEVYQTPLKIPTAEDVPLSIPDVFNPRYSYATGKIISEVMGINYGRKYFERLMIFRPHNVYGPDMGWEHVLPQFILRMKQLSSQSSGVLKFPIQGTGKESRAFIFIDDFIDGLMLMLKLGKHLEIYHLGTDDEVTIERLAHLVGKHFNREVQVIAGEAALGGTLRRCPNIDKMKKLGFCPHLSLEKGIEITADWYKKNDHLQENTENVHIEKIENKTS